MDFQPKKTYSIILNSTKEHQYYKIFKNAYESEQKENTDFINKISIFENNDPIQKDKFSIYTYSPTGQLLTIMNTFENFNDIKKVVEESIVSESDPSMVKQKGGSSSYKHKYEKYKKKYLEMKNVIVKYSS